LGGRYGLGISSGPVDITDAGGQSAWGTIGQGGNVWEWLETATDGSNSNGAEMRDQRGGSWFSQAYAVNSSIRVEQNPFVENEYNTGFRVASSIPEPSSHYLLALGGFVMFLRRRR
jgi:formylglycine-generating enzyme required for sulfatase activity